MANYFRVTAYHEEENVTCIVDSNGAVSELWELSSHLIKKGFKIKEVGDEHKFLDGLIAKAKPSQKFIVRASQNGKPKYGPLEINGQTYLAVIVDGKSYVPNRQELFE